MKACKLGLLLEGIATSGYCDETVSEVVTDSRQAGPGTVFVAVVGERFDGNDFAESAIENGAVVAIVSKEMEGDRYICVDNTLDALSAMACNYRKQFSPLCVGITGSVGKTTTKDMTAAILSSFGRTLKSAGNRNNEIGLPETVFKLDETYDNAVFEMGMAALGEISRLSRCALPDAAIITCIGVSHMESLGSRENILKAKLEIREGMKKDGLLVLNGDDDMLRSALDYIEQKVVLFGIENSDCDVRGTEIDCRGFSSNFTIVDKQNGTFRCHIPCSGIHSVMDALSAYALGTRMGFDPAGCAAALANYEPSGMRQHFVEIDGITVIEDCYNANPDSMKASLKTLADLPCEGKRIAVLGDMLELGAISADAHKNVGLQAAEYGIDIMLCYGNEMKAASLSAVNAVDDVKYFDTKDELAAYLLGKAGKGDIVLVKGSRGMALEDVLDSFYKGHENG